MYSELCNCYLVPCEFTCLFLWRKLCYFFSELSSIIWDKKGGRLEAKCKTDRAGNSSNRWRTGEFLPNQCFQSLHTFLLLRRCVLSAVPVPASPFHEELAVWVAPLWGGGKYNVSRDSVNNPKMGMRCCFTAAAVVVHTTLTASQSVRAPPHSSTPHHHSQVWIL